MEAPGGRWSMAHRFPTNQFSDGICISCATFFRIDDLEPMDCAITAWRLAGMRYRGASLVVVIRFGWCREISINRKNQAPASK